MFLAMQFSLRFFDKMFLDKNTLFEFFHDISFEFF